MEDNRENIVSNVDTSYRWTPLTFLLFVLLTWRHKINRFKVDLFWSPYALEIAILKKN